LFNTNSGQARSQSGQWGQFPP